MASDSSSTARIVIEADASGAIKVFQETGAAAQRLGQQSAATAGGGLKALQDGLGGAAQQGMSLFGSLGPMITGLGATGVAIGVATLAARSAVTQFTEFASQVRDLSYLSGGSARDISILVSGLEDLGVESGTVESALSKMSAAIVNGDPALNRLGISLRNSAGQLKSGLDLFYETTDALGAMRNEVDRNALARDIFGRGWTQMVPVLREGSESVKRLGEENAATGKIIDEQGIQNARELRMAWANLKDNAEGLAITVGSKLVPALAESLRILNALASPSAGVSIGVEERARLLENMDPLGRMRAGLPSGAVGSDAGAWRLGMPGATVEGRTTGAPGEPTLAELKRTLALQSQLAQLRAGTQAAGAVGPEAQQAASEAVINAQRTAALNGLAIAVKEGTRLEEEAAQLRVAINAEADAKIAAGRDKTRDAIIARDIAGFIAAANEEIANADLLQKYELEKQAADVALREQIQADEQAWHVTMAEQQLALDEQEALRKVELQQQEAAQVEEWRQRDLQSYIAYIDSMIEEDFRMARQEAQLADQKFAREKQLRVMMVQQAQDAANLMASAMLQMYQATGQRHQEFFKAWKAFKVVETIVATYSSAVKTFDAVVSSTGGGWWSVALAYAAAASVVAWGLAQVATIVSAEPGGGGGGGGSASVPSGGGYAYTPPVDTYRNQPSDTQGGMTVTVNVYGSIVDHDAFAREITGALKKAQEDRVR
jgi:hypothetical protein